MVKGFVVCAVQRSVDLLSNLCMVQWVLTGGTCEMWV